MLKLCLESLHVEYVLKKKKTAVAVSSLSLEVPKGQFLGILGSSGCGKSSVLKAIAGFFPFDGIIRIDGVDADKIPTSRRSLAYVSQSYDLYSNLTVFDNVAFPLRVARLPLEEINQRVTALAEEMNLTLLLSRKPRQLSLGQLQQVSLARAFIRRASLYLLDEPFSNLDFETKQRLFVFLQRRHEQEMATIILVSHSFFDLKKLCQRVVVLGPRASLLQEGTPEAIESHPASEVVSSLLKEGSL